MRNTKSRIHTEVTYYIALTNHSTTNLLSVTAIINGTLRCTNSWDSSSNSRHRLFRKAMRGSPAANSGALQHLIVQCNACCTSLGLLEDLEEEAWQIHYSGERGDREDIREDIQRNQRHSKASNKQFNKKTNSKNTLAQWTNDLLRHPIRNHIFMTPTGLAPKPYEFCLHWQLVNHMSHGPESFGFDDSINCRSIWPWARCDSDMTYWPTTDTCSSSSIYSTCWYYCHKHYLFFVCATLLQAVTTFDAIG